MSYLSLCVLALLATAMATRDSEALKPWETRRGDAIYGNTKWYQHPDKAMSSDYVKYDGTVHFTIGGHKPYAGVLPSTDGEIAQQAFDNMLLLAESAGLTKMDLMRNPVRSNDTAAEGIGNPNDALVIRAALATATHKAYGLLNAAGAVDWPKFPSDQEQRPPGRSYVIMREPQKVKMLVTGFDGSSRDAQHDFASETQTIEFNNLPFNWKLLPAAQQQYLLNNGLCLANGTCFHYSSPTSLSYNPVATVCDGRSSNQCRKVLLRSCERSFAPMSPNGQVTNAAGLVVGGNLMWKGREYPCTDVINYNCAPDERALWCRIRDDADIAVAFEIAEAHHINGAKVLGFTAADDVRLDFFQTNSTTQWALFKQFLARRYAPGRYPAIVANFGRLVGGDKIELTGEHSTGVKYYSSQARHRRVTVSSLDDGNTVRVGTEAFGTVHSGHVCDATRCALSSNAAVRIATAFDNAFDDLRAVGHSHPLESTVYVLVFVDENKFDQLKPLVDAHVAQLWPEGPKPVYRIEPHRAVWPFVTSLGGRTIDAGNDITVNLQSVRRQVGGRY